MKPRLRLPRLPLAILLAALLNSPALALEPEELRLGMTEFDAVSVYTRYRSCENAVLEEGPGRLSWRANLYGREARVELEVSAGLIVSIRYRYTLGEAEEAAPLFGILLAEKVAELGPPVWREAGAARWEGEAGVVLLKLVEAEGGRELSLDWGGPAR